MHKLTKEEKGTLVKKDNGFNNLIRNTKTLTIKELKKEGEEYHTMKMSKENALLDALEHNRLKSKDAIKQALRIKKEREAARQKREAAKQKKKEVSTKETTKKSV